MRLWLDPDRLAAHRLTASTPSARFASRTCRSPPAASAPRRRPPIRPSSSACAPRAGSTTSRSSRTSSSRPAANGALVRVKDVGPRRARRGELHVAAAVRRRAGVRHGHHAAAERERARHVPAACRRRSNGCGRSFPPGLEAQIAFDNVGVVRESIIEVLKTLGEAIVLVVLVLFLFLQNWRSTLIPAITIPVSLIGTFAFMKLLGFSINTLTLFGLVLATGTVVDDAIVVIENIERHMREYGKSAMRASVDAMAEVFSAVVVIGIVLVAVFVPVAFFPGITGRMYQQFSITIACAVIISVFNAVTLTPALSALLLRHHEVKQQGSVLPSA